MSGGSLPYHLRPNKAVERNLFLDLLARIGRYENISEYRYIGLGGPFLEEFKLIHAALRIEKMVCIEEDLEVAKRQKFNAPIKGIDFFSGRASDFLPKFFPDDPCVVWLDYASPKQIQLQLADLQTLLRKLAPGDVFKITLNANPDTLGAQDESNPNERWKKQLKKFRKRAGGFAPADIDLEEVRLSRYPRLLMRCIKRAIEQSRLPYGLVAQPLLGCVYSDGHQMLTLTGILLKESQMDDFMGKTRLNHWPFAMLDWESDPSSITVPELSMRERMKLESMLPEADGAQLLAGLGFEIADDERRAITLMNDFRIYYRMLPHYSKVAV